MPAATARDRQQTSETVKVTFRVPQELLEDYDRDLVEDSGLYPNRSEAFRAALRMHYGAVVADREGDDV